MLGIGYRPRNARIARMLDHLSAAPARRLPRREDHDPLTQILQGLRLDGAAYGRRLLPRPWASDQPVPGPARFHFVGSGGAWLHTAATGWMRLDAGDAVLLPQGAPHVLASAPAADGTGPLPAAPAGDNAADVVFCGTLRFSLDPQHPLLALMPPLMLARSLARRDPTVPALLEAMERELAQDRIGACGMLARLADALCASIIRAWVESGCSSTAGWLAALRCPRIGRVVAAIHAQPERDWRVPELASVMGASRSTFTDSFTRTLGESPARYVARVKMAQARRWIAGEGMRVSVAAQRLGYDSEASFSRAFKRVMGHAPSLERPGGRAA